MKLRGFRFHLSTAVLLMFAAGGLMWLNFHERFNIETITSDGRSSGEVCFGFPMSARVSEGTFWESNLTEVRFRQNRENKIWKKFFEGSRLIPGRGVFIVDDGGDRVKFRPTGIAVDGMFGLTVLVVMGFISEWVIRRTKKSNENQPAIN